jgi:hypothetical protein
MSIVRAEVCDSDLLDFEVRVPFKVSLRLLLNKKGIKFADDGKLSSIANEYPTPLGTLEWYHNYETQITHYKQTLPEVDEHA